jgi:hypothetical protein
VKHEGYEELRKVAADTPGFVYSGPELTWMLRLMLALLAVADWTVIHA